MTHWMRRVVYGRFVLPILPAKTPIVGNKHAFKDHRHRTEYSAFLSHMDCQKACCYGVLPPKIEHAKSNVRPFVQSQRLICWYPTIKITGGRLWRERLGAAKHRNITRPPIYFYIIDIVLNMRVGGLELGRCRRACNCRLIDGWYYLFFGWPFFKSWKAFWQVVEWLCITSEYSSLCWECCWVI